MEDKTLEQIKLEILDFVKENNNTINNFYKANLMIFCNSICDNDERSFPTHVTVCYTQQKELILLHPSNKLLHLNNDSDDCTIFEGCTIALYKDNKFELDFNSNLRVDDYIKLIKYYYEKKKDDKEINISEKHFYNSCDVCKKLIDKNGFICEKCDYDLCDDCQVNKSNHVHNMFHFTDYFGWNTFDSDDVLIRVHTEM